MKKELKPCPFCGGEPKISTLGGDSQGPDTTTVYCTVCRASSGYPTKQLMRCGHVGLKGETIQTNDDAIKKHDSEAVELWNSRVM